MRSLHHFFSILLLGSLGLVNQSLHAEGSAQAIDAAVVISARLAEIDQHALQAKAEIEQNPEALVAYLTQNTLTDKEKVRAIFRWIADRFEYDVDSYFSGQLKAHDIQELLASRKGVCDGFSSVFATLSQHAKLPVKTITGHAKGAPSGRLEDPSKANHAWNAVQIEGKWYVVDATWAAGQVNGKSYQRNLDEFYFLAPPEKLLLSHFAFNDELGVQTAVNLSHEEFIKLPSMPPHLMHAGFDGMDVLTSARQGSFKRFVETFDQPFGSFQVLDAPVQYRLRTAPQTLRISSSIFEQLAAVQGADFTYFSVRDNVFELTWQPAAGPLFIMGRKPDRTGFNGLLGYEVVAATE